MRVRFGARDFNKDSLFQSFRFLKGRHPWQLNTTNNVRHKNQKQKIK